MIAIVAKESRKQDVTIKLMKDIIRFGYSGQRKEYIQEVGLGFLPDVRAGEVSLLSLVKLKEELD